MNRQIRRRDLDVIYVTGPGHGGPGLVANTYLEGTDADRNQAASTDADVSADGATVRTVVVHAREDLEMVRLARPLLV
jgi:XFP N-terminal domain